MREAFSAVMASLHGEVLSAEKFGVPQRRKRVIVVGFADPARPAWTPPAAVTRLRKRQEPMDGHPEAISVEEALSDLPELGPGEDGCHLPYRQEPGNSYQALMRGAITPETYLSLLSPRPG